jgi:hypothetical protein
MGGLYQAFSLVLFATALVAPAAQSQSGQSDPRQGQLEYSQGHAYMGSESVKWEHDRLVFVKRVADMKGSFRETVERLEPSAEAWERFWARIDSLGVWKWKSDYSDPQRNLPDGESWSLALRHRANQVKSKGYNAVPEGYSVFRDAVYKLIEEARGN